MLCGCAGMIDTPEGQTDIGSMVTAGGSIKLIKIDRATGSTGAMYIADQYQINTNYLSMPPRKLHELRKLIDKTLTAIEE